MGKACADDHPRDEDGCIAVPFTREEELSSGTAARQGETQPREGHSQEIPKVVRMGDGLIGEAGFELTYNEVDEEGDNHDSQNPAQEMSASGENDISNRSHGAESCALGEESHAQTYEK